jgi:ribosomal protein S18 acetylase RimI-like enzyme
MNRRFVLESPGHPGIALRAVGPEDLDNLRNWKNENRRSFFFQGIISPEGQRQWFEGYLKREHDYMFLVLSEGRTAGCMGFRLLEGKGDIYNVILAVPEMGGRGVMGRAFNIMCSHALKNYPSGLGLKVLIDNPARGWYLRNGFREIEAREDHLVLEADPAAYQFCRVVETPFIAEE